MLGLNVGSCYPMILQDDPKCCTGQPHTKRRKSMRFGCSKIDFILKILPKNLEKNTKY